MHAISVVSVDLQNEFFDLRQDRVGRIEKALCLPGSRKLIQQARLNRQQIIHAVTSHKDASTLPIHLAEHPPYCLEGTAGAQIVGGLFADGDLRVPKTQFSAFFGTSLQDHLQGCDSVILCGIATDCCILQTAFDAANHRKRVYVPYQAVSATRVEAYVSGLQSIAKSAGVIVDLQALLREPGKPWAARLDAEEITERAGGWYAAQLKRLANFRKLRPELFASPVAPPEELVANLEAFLAAASTS